MPGADTASGDAGAQRHGCGASGFFAFRAGAAGQPYGYAQTDGALDEALSRLHAALPKLLALAEAEKTVHCMARELEAARRRVNALEYVLIPELQEQIRRISMKLEENERGNLVRLMKVKELVLAEARTQRFGGQ